MRMKIYQVILTEKKSLEYKNWSLRLLHKAGKQGIFMGLNYKH